MYNSNYIEHHGILGMHWGVRRYQNKDGSYTSAGRARYGYSSDTSRKMEYGQHDSSVTKKVKDDYNNLSDKEFMAKYKTSRKTYAKRVDKYGDPYMNSPMAKTGKKLSAKNVYKKDKKKALHELNGKLKEIDNTKWDSKDEYIKQVIKASEEYDMDLKSAKDKYKRKMDAINNVVKNNYNRSLVNKDTYSELNDINRKNTNAMDEKKNGYVLKDGYQEIKLPGGYVNKDGYQEIKLPGYVNKDVYQKRKKPRY